MEIKITTITANPIKPMIHDDANHQLVLNVINYITKQTVKICENKSINC